MPQVNNIESPAMPLDATSASVFTYTWTNYILSARDAMTRDQNIVSIKYEDVMSKPRKRIKQIFESL